MEGPNPIVQRIFARAAEQLGGASELSRHLRLNYSELGLYLAGEAMPPEDVLLRAVNVVIQDLKEIRSSFSEQAWRALPLPRELMNP